VAEQELRLLEEKARSGQIELIYFDQSGVSLTASVVYAWQEIGKRLEIASGKSRLQNILGFMWAGCEKFSSFVFEGGITSNIVIHCFDEIVRRIKQRTIIVLDNAPIHRSEEFEEKIEEWRRKGLEVYYLPTYSSELNKIEILWKKIKYEWLPLEAYESYQKLTEEVDKVLSQVGSKYKITFA
jgi:transposase